jgi:hypothetical protein
MEFFAVGFWRRARFEKRRALRKDKNHTSQRGARGAKSAARWHLIASMLSAKSDEFRVKNIF